MTKKHINLCLFFLAIVLSTNLEAQQLTELWTGLRKGQPQNELPKGNAPFQQSKRIPKENKPTKLISTQANEWLISNGWEMTDGKTVIESGKSIFDPQLNTSEWYNATVPGTVLTTLVEQGVYPDPFFGLNNMNIPESLSRTDWWYRCKFNIPQNTNDKQLFLLFNGINYRATVYVNGKHIGDIKGAFIRGEFNVTDVIPIT